MNAHFKLKKSRIKIRPLDDYDKICNNFIQKFWKTKDEDEDTTVKK